MAKSVAAITFAIAIAVLVLFLTSPLLATQSAEAQPNLNKVIQDVQRAEAAGARPEELGKLINELNSVNALEDQLQNLNSQEADKRSQLLGEINNSLATIDIEANQIDIAASQRTFTDHMIVYSSAGVGAALTTLVSHYLSSLWRKYRGKRALQLKIVPK
ncbi:MAG: hypothetical protein WB661_12685 [Candidatus Bathyarchaeia archaeon]